MHTEEATAIRDGDEGGKGDVAEDLNEAGPHGRVGELGADLDEEAVEARGLGLLVVAAEDEDVVGELALESEEEHDGFNTLGTSIDVVTEEEEFSIGGALHVLL